jgi:hypothetical protein
MNHVHFTAYDLKGRPQDDGPVGAIHFLSEMVRLEKVTGGALLLIEYTTHLNSGLYASINNITGEIYFQGRQSAPTGLGLAVDPETHILNTGYKFPQGSVESAFTGRLLLPLSPAALEAIERLRDGGPAEFRLTMRGSAFVFNALERTWDACMLQVDGGMTQAARVSVDRDYWSQQVRGVSPLGSVLVEIPLAVTRDAPWKAVWDRLDEASAHLAQGGEMGWEGCIAKIRQALELRAEIENVAPGPERADRDQDRIGRLDGLAKALFHYCSLAVHTDKHLTRWTRADAILAFSAFCALLAARDP